MKVGIVTNYYIPSMGMNTFYLCRSLAKHGIDVTLFCSNKYGKKKPIDGGTFEETFEIVKVDTIANIANVPIMRNLPTILSGHNFDILQTEDSYQLYSYNVARYAKSKGIPLVLRHDLSDPPAQFPYAQGFKIAERLLAKSVVNQARIGVVPNWEAWAYLRSLRLDIPLELVPYGVDTQEFSWPWRLLHDDIRILCVARLIKEKGLLELQQAFKTLRAEIPNLKLRIIGQGDFPIPEAPGLEVIHGVRHDLMPEQYAWADIFVLPTYEEAPNLSILEAMASGLPVITTKIPSMEGVITDGKNGILVLPRSTKELTDGIRRLALDKELQWRLAYAAMRKVEDGYSWDSIGVKMKVIYEEILCSP